jgi:GTP:adenosylcobinamide-phosphate guanylyltransferase
MAVVLSIKIPMHAFILAGGFATRLWPLTEKRAKPLLPLAGKPLLTHLLEKIPRDIPVTVSTNAAFANGFSEWQKMIDRPTDLIIEGTKAVILGISTCFRISASALKGRESRIGNPAFACCSIAVTDRTI